MLNRYEFELMTFIEKTGKTVYPMRFLSDSLKISRSVICDVIDHLTEDGLIFRNGEELEITDKGLEELEPYRVKKAVIIAAGFGSRMMPATADRPKPLVRVNGTRIIDTLLDALVMAGIQDISVVRGYKKEKFTEISEKYPFVKLVDNDRYDRENNISSVILASKLIDGCYLCEADLYISNPNIIAKYQYVSNILGSYSLETDDWSFQMDELGHITNYQKGNSYCWNYYGISYWTKEDSLKLRKDWSEVYEKNKDVFWEEVPLILRKDNYNVEIRQCEKSDVMEIDNYFELAQLDPTYR